MARSASNFFWHSMAGETGKKKRPPPKRRETPKRSSAKLQGNPWELSQLSHVAMEVYGISQQQLNIRNMSTGWSMIDPHFASVGDVSPTSCWTAR